MNRYRPISLSCLPTRMDYQPWSLTGGCIVLFNGEEQTLAVLAQEDIGGEGYLMRYRLDRDTSDEEYERLYGDVEIVVPCCHDERELR